MFDEKNIQLVCRRLIVFFELRSNQDIDPGLVVDYRTDSAGEFDFIFPDNDPEVDQLWYGCYEVFKFSNYGDSMGTRLLILGAYPSG